MSGRAQAFLALAAGAALLAAAGASGGVTRITPEVRAGALFTDEVTPSANESGLWLVTPTGRASQLLGRRWHPWARSKTGVIAASRSRTREGALWLRFPHRAVEVPGSATASCVSWSSDGRLLSYVTGKQVVYAHLPGGAGAWGRIGALWIVRASAPHRPLRVATGLSAWDACPAWSASGAMLAYMIRPDPASGPWTLSVYRSGSSRSVATLRTAVPAIDHAIFDWAPEKSELVFVDGTSIYRYDGIETSVLGQPGSLDPVQALSTSRGFDVSDAHVRFSPDGHFIAAGISGATGVFRRDGSLLRAFAGGFDGWAGNTGVLTLGAEPMIILRLHPIDGSSSRVISRHFKSQVATDPGGHWFAYFDGLGPTLVFRRPDGTVMRKRLFLRFAPSLVAAISADGRTAPPTGVYSSPWSR